MRERLVPGASGQSPLDTVCLEPASRDLPRLTEEDARDEELPPRGGQRQRQRRRQRQDQRRQEDRQEEAVDKAGQPALQGRPKTPSNACPVLSLCKRLHTVRS